MTELNAGQVALYVTIGTVEKAIRFLDHEEFVIPSGPLDAPTGTSNIDKLGTILVGAAAVEYGVSEEELYYEVYLEKEDTIPVRFSPNSPYSKYLEKVED